MAKKTTQQVSAFAFLTTLTFAVAGGAQAADLPQNEPADSPAAAVLAGYTFYIAGTAGANFDGEADLDGLILGAPQSVDTEFDTGFSISGAAGVELHDWRFGAITPRVEVEVRYDTADVDEVAFSGNGPAQEINVSGDVSTTYVFANAFADFDTGSPVTPFIGAGIGVGFTDFDFSYGPGVRVDDTDTGFAFQLIAGASYDLTEQLALTVDGRYTRVVDVEASRFNAAGISTGTIDGDVDNFSVNAGLRWRF